MFGFKKRAEEKSIKVYWEMRYTKARGDHEQILQEDIVWKNWNNAIMPETMVERGFIIAVEILSGSDDFALAERYLRRSIEVADNIRENNQLAAKSHFPRNQGCLIRAQVYAKSLLGEAWDSNHLCSASHDYENHCRANYSDRRDWDSQIQYYYINAIHLALLGGDIERAKILISTPPYPLKAHLEHVSLLADLILFQKNELEGNQRSAFFAAYDVFFDKARDPRREDPKNYFMEPIGPIELSLLREKCIVHPGKPVDWRNVIGEYSK